ncbi:MAG: hypothetical protein N4A53_12375 [Pelagimonas sp.]|jgi:hypothetical protein|nr:hypothetical protein [Pelagimonas sp.]
MVSSSKILTVSYGTFSCTAEGFEDPLAVVKDTTHFFRGVVGEDRFFGAEPPQFDPELAAELMRAQIVADQQDGQLTLRPALGTASAGAMGAALSAAPRPAQAGPAPDAPAQDVPPPDETDALPDDAHIEEAARLAEEEAAQAAIEAAETAPAPIAEPDTPRAEDTLAALVASDELMAETVETDPLDMQEDSAQTPPFADDTAPQQPSPAVTDAESVAAKLARIRAVVSDSAPTGSDADDALLEDDGDLAASEDTIGAISAMMSQLEGDMPGGETAEPGLTDPDLSAEDRLDESLAAVLGNDIPTADASDALAALNETTEDDSDMLWDDDDDSFDAEEDAADDLFAEEDDDDLSETDLAVPSPEEAAPTEEATTQPAPLRARVIKIKRAAFDKAVAAGQLEEVDEEDTPAPAAPASSLSAEEEAELARELAAVKAELASDFDSDWDDEWESEDSAETAQDDGGWDLPQEDVQDEPLRLDNPLSDEDSVDQVRKAVKMASPARAMLTESSIEDNDTSRLLDQTNEEMQEPEGNRRRSAIAHLRAAVAATKADRMLGGKQDKKDESEAYREDLADVVRPRRPQGAPARHSRPQAEATARPAPLKLVAEQRVAEAEQPSAPVRPRRINRSETRATTPRDSAMLPPEAPADGSDFAAYAENVGAKELSDLLEAAAAYMSFVEGRDQFSRPQLMTTVRQAELTESSREDRLRSFGQLLRDGKIEKTSGGRFTASERISFKPDRAAG